MAPVLLTYLQTGLVDRMPTWVASLVILLMACLSFLSGMILDSLARSRVENLRVRYLSIPSLGRCVPTRARPGARAKAARRDEDDGRDLADDLGRPDRHALHHRHRTGCSSR